MKVQAKHVKVTQNMHGESINYRYVWDVSLVGVNVPGGGGPAAKRRSRRRGRDLDGEREVEDGSGGDNEERCSSLGEGKPSIVTDLW